MSDQPNPPAPKVFISYSHDTPEHSSRVLELADTLSKNGLDAMIDQYESNPDQGRPLWVQENLNNSDFVLIVCTETYNRRALRQAEDGQGVDVQWTGNLIYNQLYKNPSQGRKYLPIIFNRSDADFIPEPLQGFTRYHLTDFTLASDRYQALYRHLTGQPAITKPEVGSVQVLLPINRPGLTPTSTTSSDNQTPTPSIPSSISANTSHKTAPKIFVSYSHKDVRWLEEFKIQLAPYLRIDALDLWDDKKILPGANRRQSIEAAIKAADIAVLLVTPNFLASDFIIREKLPDLLERQVVFWIAVTYSAYEIMPIANYEAANNPERPLSKMTKPNREEAWVEICKKLVSAIPDPK